MALSVRWLRSMRPVVRRGRWTGGQTGGLRALSAAAGPAPHGRPLAPSCVQRSLRTYTQWSPNVVKSPYPEFTLPDQLFHDFLWEKHEKWADRPAVTCGLTGREMSYRELRKRCRRLATSLLSSGFKPGDVLGLVLPNMPEFPVAALGAIEAGLVLSPINPAYTPDEIAYQLSDSGAVGVITFPDTLGTVLEACNAVRKEKGSELRVACTPDVTGGEADLPEGVVRFSDLTGEGVNDSLLISLLSGAARSREDVSFIPYSSGTTGRPKGVCLTHTNLISGILNILHSNDLQPATGNFQEVVPAILPGFHIYGFTVVVSFTLFHGGQLITLPKFEEKSFLNVLLKHKPTVMYVAPPLVLYIGSSPNVTKEHLASLKMILSGAAPCSESDIQKCIEKSPPTLVYKQGYGLTETSPCICIMAEKIPKYNSVGRPSRNTLVKVADLQTGQALGPMDEGEICVKGPQVMKGYLNNEKANTEVFDSEGWFHTGDIGYYDEEKHFYITDRLKELIKVKGFQVAPAELEAVLRSHPDVADAGVIGVPEPRKGESPVAFIKARPGSNVSSQALREFLQTKLAKYKQVDHYVFVDSIPKSASGKILRKVLKEEFTKNVNLDTYLKEKEA